MAEERACPGCGLSLPVTESAVYDGYYNTSPDCYLLYTEVVGYEFGNAIVFGQVHQLTVDTYAVQHAGAAHKDKSVGVHLAGLHLVLEQGKASAEVPPLLQRLAGAIEVWPHYELPAERSPLTIWDVADSDSPEAHTERVRAWAQSVWATWSARHEDVAALVAGHL